VVAESRTMKLPEALGFRNGASSVHTSRTMMLGELSLVLEHIEAKAMTEEYLAAIVDQNVLGKPTQTTRKRTAQRLVELYALDQTRAVFRLLRHFWSADASSRPLLAYMAAAARDRLLRESTPFVVAVPVGASVGPSQIAEHLAERYPTRFRPTTLFSTAQNLASSWTQAGYLTGKVNKKRIRPVGTPVVVTFALLLGYLGGLRGKMLLDTIWSRMLDRTSAEIAELATEASKQGWMNYKAAGSVVEITFPGLLTPQEEKASHEQD
jgi:pimeloyl-ACP methyl ester carboxylesterase